jgi:hypothetical protein
MCREAVRFPLCVAATTGGVELPLPDARAASRVPRRDASPVQCARCHSVFAATFESAAIPYAAYENRQCFSDAFTRQGQSRPPASQTPHAH